LTNSDQFSAAAPMAGYLFQCRLALLLGLRMMRKNPNGHISIEKFDDVAFENDNIPECLIQAKHHIDSKSLDDLSVDLWKTIRVWLSSFNKGVLQSANTRYILITTAEAKAGSAMECLRPGASEEQIVRARKLLIAAAKKSTNKVSEKGREAYLKLSDAEAKAFLSQIEVCDQHTTLIDVTDEIEMELIAISQKHKSTIAQYLEGWWLGAVGKCLVDELEPSIPVQNIIIKANEIGDMFKGDNLPVDDPTKLGAKDYSIEDEDHVFVKQMRAVNLPDTVIKRGVRDFYRASAQRSKWLRESLLLDGESPRYDATLKDKFERKFDAEIATESPSTEEDNAMFGRKLCLWAAQQQVQFRNVVETWITAGSFQGLADRSEIGWHPKHLEMFNPKTGDKDA